MDKLWTELEDNLLLKLKKKNIAYKDLLEFFPNRTQDSIRNRYWILKNKNNNQWLNEERIGFLDIETSGFNANFDYVLSWSLKYLDGKLKWGVITKRDITSISFDRRILVNLLKEFENLDLLVTYYGVKFDLPFLRTRALMQNIEFPHFGMKQSIDLYYAVKSKLKLNRNTLENATLALGIEGKNHVLGKEWMKARVGEREALKYVLEHNKQDVLILEELYKKLLPFCKFQKRSI